jgi:hypothetical protein
MHDSLGAASQRVTTLLAVAVLILAPGCDSSKSASATPSASLSPTGADVAKAPAVATMKAYAVGPLHFQAPEAGVEVGEVGVDAWEVALVGAPRAAGAAAPKEAWVTFNVVGADVLEQIPESARLPNFKGTFLGTGKPAEKRVSREIMGKQVSGDRQPGTIPHPLVIEAYEVPLAGGGAMFVGFRRLESFSQDQADAFFKMVATSLKLDAKAR